MGGRDRERRREIERKRESWRERGRQKDRRTEGESFLKAQDSWFVVMPHLSVKHTAPVQTLGPEPESPHSEALRGNPDCHR